MGWLSVVPCNIMGTRQLKKPIRNRRHPTEEPKVAAERYFAGARERIDIEPITSLQSGMLEVPTNQITFYELAAEVICLGSLIETWSVCFNLPT